MSADWLRALNKLAGTCNNYTAEKSIVFVSIAIFLSSEESLFEVNIVTHQRQFGLAASLEWRWRRGGKLAENMCASRQRRHEVRVRAVWRERRSRALSQFSDQRTGFRAGGGWGVAGRRWSRSSTGGNTLAEPNGTYTMSSNDPPSLVVVGLNKPAENTLTQRVRSTSFNVSSFLSFQYVIDGRH